MNILTIHPPNTPVQRLRFPADVGKRVRFEHAYVPGPWDLIIQWGQTPPFRNGLAPTLNTSEALERLNDPEATAALLKAHGIGTRRFEPARGKKFAVRSRFRVHVFDLRVVAVARKIKGSYRPVATWGRSKRMRRVREMAVRTVYSLGLHFAAVDVGIIGKFAFPLFVDPAPPLTKRTGQLYAKAATAYIARREARKSRAPDSVVLGTDLEFIMRRKNGSILYASRYFSRRGRIGYDQQGSSRVRGARPIVEIRPAPTSDPLELVERIRVLLRRAARRTPKKGVRWEAGSRPVPGYPIGGHIHFSGIDLTTEFLRALDNYLSIPLMMLENGKRARARRPKYGFLGEFRWESYGGFEYRVPSSWIVAPRFAQATLALAKLIAENYERLNADHFSSEETVRIFYRSDKAAMRSRFEQVWPQLEALPDYDRYAEYLDVIPQMVRENKRWNETTDIKPRWGLAPSPRKRRLGTRVRRRRR